MALRYYTLKDTTNSVDTLLMIDTAEKTSWIEELCNVAKVTEEANNGENRHYLLSYCHKKGGVRIVVDKNGRIILDAWDNIRIREIPDGEVVGYQNLWFREPREA